MGHKSKELSTETKELIVRLYRKKESRSYISDLLDIPLSTIDSVVKKYRSTGTVENQPRKGRRKLFTARDEIGLNRLGKKNCRAPLQEITTKFNDNKDHSFSNGTIRRKLASKGYKRQVAKKCVIVREVNRKKRVPWCRERCNWTVDSHWRKYIYILMKVR
jgi:transposase